MNPISKVLRKILPLQYCGAVIVAAGSATRMGGIDKTFADLAGEPVLLRSVRAFADCDCIKEIVVVVRADKLDEAAALCADIPKVIAVIAGGEDRPASVRNGLGALSKKARLAAIHDGARPLVTMEVIDRTVRAAHSYGAAAPGIPVKDTVKIVQGGVVTGTPDRSSLQAIQTPQVFDIDLLKGALKKAKKDKALITDDCSAVERIGMSVKVVEGDERNIKITTPLDLKLAEMLLEELQ